MKVKYGMFLGLIAIMTASGAWASSLGVHRYSILVDMSADGTARASSKESDPTLCLFLGWGRGGINLLGEQVTRDQGPSSASANDLQQIRDLYRGATGFCGGKPSVATAVANGDRIGLVRNLQAISALAKKVGAAN